LHSIQSNRRPSRVPAHRQANAIATLTLAFSADPTNRWCWPQTAEYLESFPAFVRALGGNAFATECAFEIAGGSGAALWLPPGVEPDEDALSAIIQSSVHTSRQGDLYELIQQSAKHHPHTPHWYLPFVGVEPMQQNRGLGGSLLRPVLERCDNERLPAYLESTNPRNVPFYESLGFRRVGMIRSGTSPEVTPMLREPQ
jgi:ribosomal protein S18 acetylase RimI-like enzyme